MKYEKKLKDRVVLSLCFPKKQQTFRIIYYINIKQEIKQINIKKTKY